MGSGRLCGGDGQDRLVLDGSQASECGLSSAAVVGPLDPSDDGDAELLAGGPGLAVQDVVLQEAEEALHGGVVARCADFAHELGAELGLQVELNPGFREVGFGEWEGKSAEELLMEDNHAISAFWNDPVHNTPPGGESLPDFQQRVITTWLEMLDRHAGKHLLLVGHAGMMRILLLHLLDLPLESFYRFDPRNAAIIRIRIDSGRHGEQWPQLVFPGS